MRNTDYEVMVTGWFWDDGYCLSIGPTRLYKRKLGLGKTPFLDSWPMKLLDNSVHMTMSDYDVTFLSQGGPLHNFQSLFWKTTEIKRHFNNGL